MRIGFDASPLARPHPPGVQRVARELLAELERRARIEVVRLAPERGEPLRRWRHARLPRLLAREGLAGLHSFVSAFPWRGPGKRVHTLHELPWKSGERENAGLAHRLWAFAGPRRADATVVPSPRVARQLGRRLAADGGRVHVVPWGVAERFADEPPPGVVDELVLDRYRLPQTRLALCLGAVRPKKRLDALLRGVARLRERGGPDLHVVVTGEHTESLRRDLGLVARLSLSRWVSTPGEVEDEDLPALLRLATVVPVLSRSEGFALPVLEALACGTPVVVPEDSVQAELAGEHAILVRPDEPDSVAAGLEEAVLRREELRLTLAAGARDYTWTRAAQTLEELWQGLAS